MCCYEIGGLLLGKLNDGSNGKVWICSLNLHVLIIMLLYYGQVQGVTCRFYGFQCRKVSYGIRYKFCIFPEGCECYCCGQDMMVQRGRFCGVWGMKSQGDSFIGMLSPSRSFVRSNLLIVIMKEMRSFFIICWSLIGSAFAVWKT